jgi:hypothetical protein
MKHVNALVILAISVLFFSPARAHAQAAASTDDPTVVGTIIEVEGSATMTRPGQAAVAAKTEMPVHMNDVIDTAAGAKADILFIDNTEVTLGEKAQLKVDEYVYDPDNMNANKGRFSIPQGAFQFVTGQIDKISNPDVKIGTAYGAIGVRGTTIIGGDVDESYGVFVKDGAADVINNGGKVRLGAGEGTSLLGRDRAPAAAKRWSPEKIGKAFGLVHLKRAAFVQQLVAQHKQMFGKLLQQRKLLRKGMLPDNLQQKMQLKQELRENRIERREEKRGDGGMPQFHGGFGRFGRH